MKDIKELKWLHDFKIPKNENESWVEFFERKHQEILKQGYKHHFEKCPMDGDPNYCMEYYYK